MKLELSMTGDRPLIMHNGRLANPIDPHTRQLKAITSKRKKTDDDLIEIMVAESRGAAYETTSGLIGLPTSNVWRAVYDAAKAYKLGEDVKRSLLFAETVEPLEIDGRTWPVDEFLDDPAHIDYRAVKIGRVRTMRARPLIPTGWQCSAIFDLLDDVLQPNMLGPVIERAGRLVGLCDWRPTYGTFAGELLT